MCHFVLYVALRAPTYFTGLGRVSVRPGRANNKKQSVVNQAAASRGRPGWETRIHLPRPALPHPSMPPFTRQQTWQSVRSWWSDSNPAGATIDLHAATKPLMKLMYHRQALRFVKRNRDVPLTPETGDILELRVVRPDSHGDDVGFVFDFLTDFALSSEGAEGVVAAQVPDYLLDGLGSPNGHVRLAACLLTQALARHECTAAAIITVNPCNQLMALAKQLLLLFAFYLPTQIDNHHSSMDTPEYEADLATEALIATATWPAGAEAIVAPLVLHHAGWLA
ncbi:hypothetical protein FB451DRAFT_1551265 [Mycena latifolia]|nr:hypothetical protein FB451DRAFT_1551265 [Mycena latifolia]